MIVTNKLVVLAFVGRIKCLYVTHKGIDRHEAIGKVATSMLLKTKKEEEIAM